MLVLVTHSFTYSSTGFCISFGEKLFLVAMSSHDEDDDTMPQSKRVRLDDADVIDLYDSPTEDDDDHTVDISQWGINKLYADNVDAVHKVVKGLAADNVDQLVKANIKVIEHPFRVVQMKDFLKEETLLEVKAALPRLGMCELLFCFIFC